MESKKGQAIEGLQSLVAPLIGIAIVLVIGFLIMAQAKEQAIDNIPSASITNESITWSNNTNVAFGVSTGLVAGSCSSIVNGSGGTLISSGNYTCSINGLKLLDNNNHGWATAVYVNYSYKNATYATNGTGDVQNAMQDIPGWLPIIVITVIGAILLGLVANFRKQ